MSRVLEGTNQITQKYKVLSHRGIDLVKKSSSASNIIAHSDGVVVEVVKNCNKTYSSGHSYGNYVKIKHANGYYTLYAHLKYKSVCVSVGDKVKQGQVIGYMGKTGHSKGVHLHFEVRNEKDVRINPTKYIDADLPNLVKATHKVVKGDSISGICKKYYGSYNNTLGKAIVNANKSKYPKISLNYIVVGWTLTIPTN